MPRGGFATLVARSYREEVLDPTEWRTTSLPDRRGKDLKLGTLRAAVRQLGLDWGQFHGR